MLLLSSSSILLNDIIFGLKINSFLDFSLHSLLFHDVNVLSLG